MRNRLMAITKSTKILLLLLILSSINAAAQSTSVAKSSGPQMLKDKWRTFAGIGFSGSTFGRQVPGIHLAGHARYVEASLYSTGTSSELSSSSHQNALVGFPFLVTSSSWFKLTNTVGIATQINERKLNWEGQTQRSGEQVWGAGFAATSCLFDHLCLRLEGFFGLQLESFAQIYQENAMGSIGVAL